MIGDKRIFYSIVDAIMRDSGCLSMAYQPKIDLASKCVIGFESLLRWKHDGVLLNPQFVVEAASKAGFQVSGRLLENITKHVIADLERAAPSLRSPVSINLSPDQVTIEYAQFVMNEMALAGIEPSLIEIEVTEHVPFGLIESFRERVKIVQSFGLNIWLDDFGQGYSSLSNLASISVYGVKLDCSFAHNAESRLGFAMIQSIVSLCHNQGLMVITEGIETEEQHQIALACGSHHGQGYFYGRPEICGIDEHSCHQPPQEEVKIEVLKKALTTVEDMRIAGHSAA